MMLTRNALIISVLVFVSSCAPAASTAPAVDPTNAPVIQPAQAPVVQPSQPGSVATPPFGYPDVSGLWIDENAVMCSDRLTKVKVGVRLSKTLISGEVSGLITIIGKLDFARRTGFKGKWEAVGSNTLVGKTSQGETLEITYIDRSRLTGVISIEHTNFYRDLCYQGPEAGDTAGFSLVKSP